MTTILTREDNVIIHITTGTVIEENGMYVSVNEQIKIPQKIAAHKYEVEIVPEEVAPIKYCYAEGAFSLNPNYKEFYSEEERISALEDVVNTLLGF